MLPFFSFKGPDVWASVCFNSYQWCFINQASWNLQGQRMMRGDAERASEMKSNFFKSISGMIHLGEKTLSFKETVPKPRS